MRAAPAFEGRWGSPRPVAIPMGPAFRFAGLGPTPAMMVPSFPGRPGSQAQEALK
ncbi:MAG: hypothetical protein LBU69_03150 [Deltaproteobacteria bacterium]|nr:hypothetical protein [Deltaproteobacteria bacterium]